MESGQDQTSEAERVRELPLFPLDLVLFPLMGVPLHIFEDRYKQLIHRCVRESLPFGIVLMTDDDEGQKIMSRVGCSARIARVERLPDGCMNIEIVGEERFRVIDRHEAEPYLTGIVTPLHDAVTREPIGSPLVTEVTGLLIRFLTLHLARMGRRLPALELPNDPLRLSYTASCVLPIENPQRQALLECTDTVQRLRAARIMLTQEVERMAQEAEEDDPQPERTFEAVQLALFERFRCNN